MRFCTQCGGMNDDANAVCSQCGAPFAAGNAPVQQPAPQPPQGYAQPSQPAAPQGQGYAQAPPQGAPPPAQNVPPPQAYGAQPYPPGPQGYPPQPWPTEGVQPVQVKLKSKLWLWLGPVIGVVAIGVVLLVLWLAGVFGGGSADGGASLRNVTDNPFIDAVDQFVEEGQSVAFASTVDIDRFDGKAGEAMRHAGDKGSSAIYASTKESGFPAMVEKLASDGYEVIIVVNTPRSVLSKVEQSIQNKGAKLYFIDVPQADGAAADDASESSTRPASSAPASEPASASSSASVPATDNPFILALREYAQDGQQNVHFISHNEIDDFGTQAREALRFTEGGVQHVVYTSTTGSDLGRSIEEAMTEGAEVIILVNAGKTYPEHAEKCAAEGIGLHYIEVPFEPPAPGGDMAAGLAGNPFYEALMEQLEKGSHGAVMVGQVGEPCMQDALRAQEYLESQGYSVVNLLNEEAGVIYEKVLLLLAAGEVDMVLMANLEYQTLIEAVYEYGFEIVYITT